MARIASAVRTGVVGPDARRALPHENVDGRSRGQAERAIEDRIVCQGYDRGGIRVFQPLHGR